MFVIIYGHSDVVQLIYYADCMVLFWLTDANLDPIKPKTLLAVIVPVIAARIQRGRLAWSCNPDTVCSFGPTTTKVEALSKTTKPM